MTKENRLVTTFNYAVKTSDPMKIDQVCSAPFILTSDWDQLKSLPAELLLRIYKNTVERADCHDVKRGMRVFSAYLLERQMITMDDYVSLFGGQAANYLSVGKDNQFYAMKGIQDATDITYIYSRAKHGSIEDIRFLAGIVITMFSQSLDDTSSHWRKLFETARANGDCVVLMTTGWRNVPSTANVLYDIVVGHINLKLGLMGLPTIISIKLPRIAPPCENYASLSPEERDLVNQTQDHVIPDKNLYQWSGVHVIFGDDVLVTGATADKVYFESMRNGAKSFQAIYPVAINPVVALSDASVEERLNMVAVNGCLDEVVSKLLSNADYQPILRTLRLLFRKQNYLALADFLPRVPDATWLKLYVSALGNDFFQQKECIASLELLKDHLIRIGLLNSNGMLPTIR